ncbi:hypothetical protein JHK87_052988 [Glycine soja]|nr:hypothetical protein JHK87_052988 [Glycine soja]
MTRRRSERVKKNVALCHLFCLDLCFLCKFDIYNDECLRTTVTPTSFSHLDFFSFLQLGK